MGCALRGAATRARVPLIPREGKNTLPREPNTLTLKHETLKVLVAHAVGTRAGATLSIDHAMPRDASVVGKSM